MNDWIKSSVTHELFVLIKPLYFYIARFLGAGPLGKYSVAMALLFWLHLPASAIDSAVTKRVSEGIDRGEFLSAGVLINGGLAIAVALGILLFGPYVDAYVGHPASFVIAVLAIGYFALNAVAAGLKGQKRVAASTIVWTTGRVVRTALQIALTYLVSLGIAGLLWGHAISLLVATVIAIPLYVIRPTRPTMAHVRRLVEYARYSWLGTLKGRAFTWMDTIVMAFFVSSSLIGIYEVTWTMASTLAVVSVAINQTLFPSMSELDARNEREEIKDLLNEGLIFAGIFAIPGLFGAAVVGSRVLKIYGPAFGQGGTILLLLIVARLANTYSGQFMSTINAIDRPDMTFRDNAVFVVVNLAANLILVPIFGWIGAATATAASSILALALNYYVVTEVLGGIDFPINEIGKEVVASLVMVLVIIGIEGIIPQNRVMTVGIVFCAAALYVFVLFTISQRIRSKMVTLLPQSVRGGR